MKHEAWKNRTKSPSDRLTPLEGFVGVALTSPVSLEVALTVLSALPAAWTLEPGAMLRLAGVWRGVGAGPGSGFLQGVDLTGRASDSEGLRLWTEMDLRPTGAGSGARLMTDERRDLAAVAAGTAGTAGAQRPLEFSDEFNLAEEGTDVAATMIHICTIRLPLTRFL